MFFIDCDHPGFTYWLALKLSISENYEIPLLMDNYLQRTRQSSNQFVNKVEYETLDQFMKCNIYHNRDDKKLIVANWIREKREKIDRNEPNVVIDRGEVKTVNYNRENLPYIEQFVDEFAGSEYLIEDNNDKIDDRIYCDTLSTEEVREYFLKLENRNDKRDVILESDAIEHLLCSNFRGFEFEERKLLAPKVSKGALMKFIYTFYRDIDGSSYNGRQLEYCEFLKNNFAQFKNDKLEDLSKKLASANPKFYPF